MLNLRLTVICQLSPVLDPNRDTAVSVFLVSGFEDKHNLSYRAVPGLEWETLVQ